MVRYQAPVIAFRFDWGEGRVFHVISHFWNQRCRAPSERHAGPGADFLRAGMRLSDEGIERVLGAAGDGARQLSFAMLQAACTSTELVVRLCLEATA